LFAATMNDIQLLSTLIGDIYDAAIDPTLWVETLGSAARFVGGQAAALFSKSAESLTGTNVYDSGIDPHYTQLYFQNYIKIDPLTLGHVFTESCEPIATSDLVPYDEFLRSPFYREWAQPQGFVDFVASVLDKSPASAALFGVFRHERDGIVDDETRQRMRLIVPHIRRATLVAGVIDLRTTAAANLAESLDGLSASLFLVDAEGRLVHANAAGNQLLAAADVFRIANGRLAAVEAPIDRELRETIAATASGDGALGTKGMALPLIRDDGERYVAHALPLASDMRRNAGGRSATLALFVNKAGLSAPSQPEAIARAYKLTLTELRVLLAIVDVGGAPEVANALGIATSTVKTHLSRLYEKTGVRRQADLAKLVAGFSTPLLR
jgi:DNA-binding CsgD family transcriptional regulator